VGHTFGDHRALELAHDDRLAPFDVDLQTALQDEPSLIAIGVAMPGETASDCPSSEHLALMFT
jgi:hypothetical protein